MGKDMDGIEVAGRERTAGLEDTWAETVTRSTASGADVQKKLEG